MVDCTMCGKPATLVVEQVGIKSCYKCRGALEFPELSLCAIDCLAGDWYFEGNKLVMDDHFEVP